MLIVQSLGRMDEMLRRTDERIAPYAARREDPPNIDLTLHFTHSYLWVLGTYEITRTVDQRARQKANLFLDTDAAQIKKLKWKFERLRIPLAKLEPSHRHKGTDFSFPLPAFDATHGTAWVVSADIFVARHELADSFLEVFESIRHSKRGGGVDTA
jgi:hypothetical protein